VHQVADQTRLYYDALSTNHQDLQYDHSQVTSCRPDRILQMIQVAGEKYIRSSNVKYPDSLPMRTGPICCPETSVRNTTLYAA